MQRCIFRTSITVLLVSMLLATPTRSNAKPGLEPQPASSAYELINAVNALRASHGLPPYTINSILMSTAQAQADYMAATGNVTHTGPGGSSVTERLLAAGYPLAGDLSLGGFRSENITSGNESMTGETAVQQWTGDAPHLTTMISPNLSEIGAGVTVYNGRVYYVIDCAQPTASGSPQAATTLWADVSTPTPGGGVVFPVVMATPNADGDVIHEVIAGQSLWQIAITYETRIDEIKRLNNLPDDNIYPGNKLLIRKGTAASPVPPIETATRGVVPSPTRPFIVTATDLPNTAVLATPERTQSSVSMNRIMQSAVAIIVLALLGGWFFLWLGSSDKDRSSAKESQ